MHVAQADRLHRLCGPLELFDLLGRTGHPRSDAIGRLFQVEAGPRMHERHDRRAWSDSPAHRHPELIDPTPISRRREGVPRITSSSRRPTKVGGSQNLRIDDIDGYTGCVRGDLVEDVYELNLILVARDVADVRRANDVAELEERIGRTGDGLLFINIHRRHTGTTRLQCVE